MADCGKGADEEARRPSSADATHSSSRTLGFFGMRHFKARNRAPKDRMPRSDGRPRPSSDQPLTPSSDLPASSSGQQDPAHTWQPHGFRNSQSYAGRHKDQGADNANSRRMANGWNRKNRNSELGQKNNSAYCDKDQDALRASNIRNTYQGTSNSHRSTEWQHDRLAEEDFVGEPRAARHQSRKYHSAFQRPLSDQRYADNSNFSQHKVVVSDNHGRPSGGRKNRKQDFRPQQQSARHLELEAQHEVPEQEQTSVKQKQGHNYYSKKRVSHNQHHQTSSHVDEDASQRDRLIDQLRNGEYECMVCCEGVLVKDAIWSCTSCFHVFHLNCIYKWAKSPAALIENIGWRCPACQSTTVLPPSRYFCFCGKVEKPRWNPCDIPHSCGNVCGKKREQGGCPHHCTLLCHPGPCPPCSAFLRKKCECGNTVKYVRCGQTTPVVCDAVCQKLLNCGLHRCQKQCHPGSCDSCEQMLTQACFCGKNHQIVKCTSETSGVHYYSCASECGKKLSCGVHNCKLKCHPEECPQCELLPENKTRCPCGKSSLQEIQSKKGLQERMKCTDPVPTCGNICGLELRCGPINNPHRCLNKCHLPPCPPCPGKTLLRCRCGGQSKHFPCESLKDMPRFLCERRCNKKKFCGRHKCLNLCCTDESHPCMLVCNRRLSCAQHFCQERCHKGNCPPCRNVSFDDLTCHCGASVLYPPIPCGTSPPECNQPCRREHPCTHPVQHTCHSDEKCPPCTVLVEKWCFGEHELRSNVPCHLVGLSCGKTCEKPLPCGSHTCQLVCHKGPCAKEGDTCTQPCKKQRSDCGHPCGAPCHQGPCPDSVCKALISVTCLCGLRNETIPCGENSRLYNQVSAPLLASKMQRIQSGQTVDISDVISSSKTNKHGKLECNEQCALTERNRRLALALQIRNPDLSNKPGPPNYSDFLREETKKNLSFVTSVFDQLTELVQSAKKGKSKLRTHLFQPMNREHRRVIHELAEFFGCKTESIDLEPKRSVEVTAFRDKSWLPSVSIMSVVQRDLGQRKGPLPVVAKEKKKDVAEGSSAAASASKNEDDVIDYFNFS